MGPKNAQLNRLLLTVLVSSMLLAGCGGGMGGCNDKKDDGSVSGFIVDEPKESKESKNGSSGSNIEDVGPQYQRPTLENLQGVEQKFPAKYPLKRYPNSRVVMVDVRPDLRPGQHNVVLLKSSDKGPPIGNYYRTELPKEGWKLTYQAENVAYTQLRYRKGDQEIEVRVMPDPQGRRHVQLVSGPYLPIQTFDDDLPAGTNQSPSR